MTVSVIIPCYRDSATLARAIDSVLAQTYPEIEVIVVNDCSPESDRIEAVLATYPQVRYIRNERNMGLAGTRNVGIRAADGEFIALLDADDEYLPTKIEEQFRAVEHNLAVTCGVLNVFRDGARYPSRLASFGERLVVRPTEIHFRNTLNGAGLFIKRSLLLANGLFDETLRSCEDLDLWLRLLGNGVRVKDIGLPLYAYHANPAGLSKDLRNISIWEIEVIRRYGERKGEEWIRSQESANVWTVWLMRQIVRSESIDDPSFRKQVAANLEVLECFPFRKSAMRALVASRLLFVPVQVRKYFLNLRNWRHETPVR
jgi:glycosyltransferase involved in cell wall biosynthesis